MYSGQHRTSKNSSNSSGKPAPSQFAPRGFVIQPKTPEVTPQQDQTPEEQTQKEETQQYKSAFIDISKLTRRTPVAATPRVQMKLNLTQQGDIYGQEADSMAERVMSMDTPTAESQTIQRHSEEPFDSIQQQPLVQGIHPLVQRQIELNRIQRQPITSISPLIQRLLQKTEGNITSQSTPNQENTSLESRLASQKGSDAVKKAKAETKPSVSLTDKIRALVELVGPLESDTSTELIAAIHAAPVAERQAVLNDEELRNLISSRLGDKATTVMSALLEGSQQWVNPPTNDFFDYFVKRRGKGTLPNAATMNCWESILYAAYLAKRIDADWIKQFYQNAISSTDQNQAVWNKLGWSKSLPKYPKTKPSNGQLLFYYTEGDPYPGHVAISLGGEQAMSLWEEPNNVNVVQRIKVTDLSGTVYIGNPQW